MTILVTALTVVVVVLAVLVAGLLRSHATILRRLHELGAGVEPGAAVVPAARPAPAATGPRRPAGVPATAPAGRAGSDLVGTSPSGDPVAIRVREVDHDTVLAFLSSGCTTCAGFWEAFGEGVPLPGGARLVVVVRDLVEESPALLDHLVPGGVTVVCSSAAWDDHGVPGSPYVVHVDGASGRVRGEGTGGSWEQVARMLADATGDLAYVGGPRRGRRAAADLRREQDTDGALLAAGFLPGDERLYVPPGTDPETGTGTSTDTGLPLDGSRA